MVEGVGSGVCNGMWMLDFIFFELFSSVIFKSINFWNKKLYVNFVVKEFGDSFFWFVVFFGRKG